MIFLCEGREKRRRKKPNDVEHHQKRKEKGKGKKKKTQEIFIHSSFFTVYELRVLILFYAETPTVIIIYNFFSRSSKLATAQIPGSFHLAISSPVDESTMTHPPN